MLEFAAPGGLWLAALVAATGAWGLLRGQRRGRLVSSVRLWSGLTPGATESRRRMVDPLWLLVWLAAVAGAACIAGPRWASVSTPAALHLTATWTVREFRSGDGPGTLGLFGRVTHAAGVNEALEIRILAPSAQAMESVSLAALRDGWSFSLPAAPERDRLSVELRDAGSQRVLSTQTFTRPPGVPFALYSGAGVAASLRRAFEVQPGATTGNPALRPAIALVNDPDSTPPRRPELSSSDLVVAGPDVAPPGVDLGERVTAEPGGWAVETDTAAGLPAYIQWQNVRVHALREARLSPEWRVLARAGGRPFIAMRPGTEGVPAWLWAGADLDRDTDWWKSPSFVVFFAEVAHQALGRAQAGRLVTWAAEPLPVKSPPAVDPTVRNLTPPLGTVAIAMLAGAVGWLLFRGNQPPI